MIQKPDGTFTNFFAVNFVMQGIGIVTYYTTNKPHNHLIANTFRSCNQNIYNIIKLRNNSKHINIEFSNIISSSK